jgi:hypothetical protein
VSRTFRTKGQETVGEDNEYGYDRKPSEALPNEAVNITTWWLWGRGEEDFVAWGKTTPES